MGREGREEAVLNALNTINTDRLSAFLLAVVLLFSFTMIYVVLEYIRLKIYVNKAVSYERLSTEIISVDMLFAQEKNSLKQYPTLYNYVKDIDPLFNDYLLDFHKAKIVRYDRSKEEMRKFREEYRRASSHIQKLVFRYSELLKRIYRANHPIRFLLDNCLINAKIYFSLLRLAIHLIVTCGIRLLFTFTFKQQRSRFEYARTLESIAENSKMNYAS